MRSAFSPSLKESRDAFVSVLGIPGRSQVVAMIFADGPIGPLVLAVTGYCLAQFLSE